MYLIKINQSTVTGIHLHLMTYSEQLICSISHCPENVQKVNRNDSNWSTMVSGMLWYDEQSRTCMQNWSETAAPIHRYMWVPVSIRYAPWRSTCADDNGSRGGFAITLSSWHMASYSHSHWLSNSP